MPQHRSSPLSPQKRRQTIAPGDFTFRADGNGTIHFGESKSPGVMRSMGGRGGGRPSIRHVSAEPQVVPVAVAPPPTVQGSKKRKFEFENSHAELTAAENKENGHVHSHDPTAVADEEQDEAEHRPLKRAKTSNSSPEKTRTSSYNSPTKSSAAAANTASTTRLPTLGVKPKGTKTAIGGVKGKAAKGGKQDGQGRGNVRPGTGTTTISHARLNALAQPKKRE
ncbi:hypothetical protein B0A55_06379 [Friedmanniomyces simplex]|uniref:Uncharacterized protein n=1 Tax=Friedmanniomyces simplex TaxID=329884 RepID=A0A4V5NGT0_9PEZI|nr:hypothetical protein B0A55_06379 [Friedmanniomyces simplex]